VGVPAMRAWVKLMRHIERYVREGSEIYIFWEKRRTILVSKSSLGQYLLNTSSLVSYQGTHSAVTAFISYFFFLSKSCSVEHDRTLGTLEVKLFTIKPYS